MASVEREKPARELVSRSLPMMEAVMGKMATRASWITAVGKAIWKSFVVSSRRMWKEDVDEGLFSPETSCWLQSSDGGMGIIVESCDMMVAVMIMDYNNF